MSPTNFAGQRFGITAMLISARRASCARKAVDARIVAFTAQATAIPNLTPGLISALRDVASYAGRPYWFRPAKMQRLSYFGLVESYGPDELGRTLWRITEAGRAALKELET